MEDSARRFEKFVIKRLVRRVEYNPGRGEYLFDRIHLTDDMLHAIEEEGGATG